MQMARCNGKMDESYREIVKLLKNYVHLQVVKAEEQKLARLKEESEEKERKARELEQQTRK